MEQLMFALTALLFVTLSRADYTQFCRGNPCPEYTVDESNSNYEKRNYVATMWATTSVAGKDATDLLAAINKLTDFWKKQEQAGQKMPDSWPALITQRTVGGADLIFLSWFLPPGLDVKVSDTSVTIENKDASTIYVRSFDGVPSLNAGLENAEILKEVLTKTGITFDPQTFSAAFYESYFALTHHNEIWLYGA